MIGIRKYLILFSISLLSATPILVNATVLYDEGQYVINGVLLLQDSDDPLSYYYLPPTPRVAPRPDGSGPDMFFVKFVDPKGSVNGGLLHLLFTLDLPAGDVEVLQKALRKKVPKAVVRGPVPLLAPQAVDNGESPNATFQIISSTLTPASKNGFTTTLVSSGRAPLTPGSRAAVAARLNEHGATLLWDSLTKPTSDISIGISASYEAEVRGYKGRVKADLSTVYNHLFKVLNKQSGYSKHEVRNQVDELIRNGVVEVNVEDRAGLKIDTSKMSGMLNLVTDKLVSMLFDTTQGLSKLPEREQEGNPVPGRQQRSTLSKFFGGNSNTKYISDNQYTLRSRKDIRQGQFSLVFNQNTTIRIPFNTSGNIRGLYKKWSHNSSVYRVINLNDPDFQRREVFFEIDPSFYNAFHNTINSVSVSFVKRYPPEMKQNDYTAELIFNQNDVKAGKFTKSVMYPRLGLNDEKQWLSYRYRILWSFRGGKMIAVPSQKDSFQASTAPYVTLAPPVNQTVLEVDGNASDFLDAGIRRAEVTVRGSLLGRDGILKRIPVSPGKGELLQSASFLSDRNSTPEYDVRWYYSSGKIISQNAKELEDTYLFLTPPREKTQ